MTTTPDAVWRDALAALPDADTVSARELLALISTLGDMKAALDAARVRAAGQLVRRWNTLDDEPGGAELRDGHRNPAGLLAERWQVSYAVAKQECSVGEAITPRMSILGEVLPAPFPLLASSLDPDDPSAGRVSVDQAAVIVRELEKAAPACTVESLVAGEHLLVRHAPNLTVADVRTLAGQVRDRLDQDGILPREQVQTMRRSLTINTTTDGMTHIDWYLHPEAAGHVITAIDALVGNELRTVRFRDTHGADYEQDAAEEERRSLAQLRSDAAVDVFRHYATGNSSQTANLGAAAARSKPAVTMVVRIGLESLRTGDGFGEIDGIPTPISASTARRMAADANIIPIVLNGDSEFLDLGRAQRLFSPKQKLALAERDGGCAWAGCPHPPSYTEAHHLRWWDQQRGATDLDNGILLCSHHHHRIHDNGWTIEMREKVPWFIPPSHVDPRRRARQGGRIRIPERTNAA
jgi:hypothetical protein